MNPETDVELNGIDDSETAMDAILALDDLYKEGQLPEEAYLKRRAELKAHLQGAYRPGRSRRNREPHLTHLAAATPAH